MFSISDSMFYFPWVITVMSSSLVLTSFMYIFTYVSPNWYFRIFSIQSININVLRSNLFEHFLLDVFVIYWGIIDSVQFSSASQLCPTLCDPMNRSTPGLPVHHQLPELTQTHVHQVSDAIQPSHPLSSPSLAPNPSQHQSLFQWVNSSHEVAEVLEFQL